MISQCNWRHIDRRLHQFARTQALLSKFGFCAWSWQDEVQPVKDNPDVADTQPVEDTPPQETFTSPVRPITLDFPKPGQLRKGKSTSKLDLEDSQAVEVECLSGDDEEDAVTHEEDEEDGLEPITYQDNDTVQILSDEDCVLASPLKCPPRESLPPPTSQEVPFELDPPEEAEQTMGLPDVFDYVTESMAALTVESQEQNEPLAKSTLPKEEVAPDPSSQPVEPAPAIYNDGQEGDLIHSDDDDAGKRSNRQAFKAGACMFFP